MKRRLAVAHGTVEFTWAGEVQFAKFKDNAERVKGARFCIHYAIRVAVELTTATLLLRIKLQRHLARGQILLHGVIFERVGELRVHNRAGIVLYQPAERAAFERELAARTAAVTEARSQRRLAEQLQRLQAQRAALQSEAAAAAAAEAAAAAAAAAEKAELVRMEERLMAAEAAAVEEEARRRQRARGAERARSNFAHRH